MYFYKCIDCGKVVMSLDKLCCLEDKMIELVPNVVDASFEKHIPTIEEKDGSVIVKVGEIAHPMSAEHYIEWIVVHTDQGYKVKHLKPENMPSAEFALQDNEIVFSAYAYCNLHGLWKKSIE